MNRNNNIPVQNQRKRPAHKKDILEIVTESSINFLTSMIVAVILLAFMTLTYILSALIPLGRPESFYFSTYPPILANIILFINFDNFYNSLLFFIPLILFFIKLAACTIQRFSKNLHSPGRKRFGPDIIHTGLLCLIVAGGITFSGHSEKLLYLRPGDIISLPGNQTLHLNRFDYSTYSDGRPKDWISRVTIHDSGKENSSHHDIKVNHPLMLNNISVYQTDFKKLAFMRLENKQKQNIFYYAGDRIPYKDGYLFFKGLYINDTSSKENPEAYFEYWKDAEIQNVVYKVKNDILNGLTITDISLEMITGLSFVQDPVPWFIILSFIIIAAGLGLTYFQKSGDME